MTTPEVPQPNAEAIARIESKLDRLVEWIEMRKDDNR